MATIEVQVPDIGDFDEVTVIELMVKVGDTVKEEQNYLNLFALLIFHLIFLQFFRQKIL